MRPDRRITRTLMALVIAAFILATAQDGLSRYAEGRLNRPASEQLKDLAIAPERDVEGYDRARFGDDWATGPDGCDTRAQVLIAEAITPPTVDSAGCQVTAGQWVSVYDALETTDPAQLDVDHLVPLAEAWASGARTWTDTRREAFANDIDHPDALVAVTAGANRAKGDADPAEWLPPNAALRCWYATAWITQKAAWGLTVDPAEHQALTQLLATCPDHQTGGSRR